MSLGHFASLEHILNLAPAFRAHISIESSLEHQHTANERIARRTPKPNQIAVAIDTDFWLMSPQMKTSFVLCVSVCAVLSSSSFINQKHTFRKEKQKKNGHQNTREMTHKLVYMVVTECIHTFVLTYGHGGAQQSER